MARRWGLTIRLCVAACFCTLATAHAEHGYVIAVGNNGAPAGSEPPALRYADDSAVAFYQFAAGMSRDAYLLAALDTETLRRIFVRKAGQSAFECEFSAQLPKACYVAGRGSIAIGAIATHQVRWADFGGGDVP